jgi:hypothetical protein
MGNCTKSHLLHQAPGLHQRIIPLLFAFAQGLLLLSGQSFPLLFLAVQPPSSFYKIGVLPCDKPLGIFQLLQQLRGVSLLLVHLRSTRMISCAVLNTILEVKIGACRNTGNMLRGQGSAFRATGNMPCQWLWVTSPVQF